jgi:hypothetical protein
MYYLENYPTFILFSEKEVTKCKLLSKRKIFAFKNVLPHLYLFSHLF